MIDETRVEKLEKLLENAEAYKKVFKTPEGEAVLLDLARKLYFDSPTHKEGDHALDLARKEGMRQAYCIILREVGKDTLAIINTISKLNENKPKKQILEFVNESDDILNGGM